MKSRLVLLSPEGLLLDIAIDGSISEIPMPSPFSSPQIASYLELQLKIPDFSKSTTISRPTTGAPEVPDLKYTRPAYSPNSRRRNGELTRQGCAEGSHELFSGMDEFRRAGPAANSESAKLECLARPNSGLAVLGLILILAI